jgi:hypothetical protein
MELSLPFENAFLSPPVHNLLSASSPQGALFGASLLVCSLSDGLEETPRVYPIQDVLAG